MRLNGLFHRLPLAAIICLGMALPAMAQTKVRVAYLLGSHFDLLFVAKDKGMFEKNGLDVSLTNMNKPSDHPAALISGSMDIGYASPLAILQANQNGLDLVALGAVARETPDHPDVGVVARKGSGITSPQDLAGKKVAVSGINSNMHLMLIYWLKQKGVDTSKMQFVEVPMANGADALRGGSIDAMAIIEPFLTKATAGGAGELLANYIAQVEPGALMGVWTTTRQWAEKNRDTVKKFNASMVDALKYVEQHPEVIAEVEKKYNGFVSSSAPSFILDFKPVDFNIWITVGKAGGALKNPPNPDTLAFQ